MAIIFFVFNILNISLSFEIDILICNVNCKLVGTLCAIADHMNGNKYDFKFTPSFRMAIITMKQNKLFSTL
jgi:hypothetical protein